MNSIVDSTIAAGTALHHAVSRTTATAPDSIHTNDCVCLTQQAACLDSVQRALEPTPPMDTARIEALRQALADGSYAINPQVIAQRMVELDKQLVR